MNLEKKLESALKNRNPEDLKIVFEEIYNANFKLVYFVIKFYVPKPMIEDLLQDTFLNFYNHLEDYNFSSNISSYLCKIAHNISINYLKKNMITLDEKIEEHIVQNETRDSIIPILERHLTKEELDIIITHVLVGYSLQEISIMKNENKNTIKSIYHRAMIKAKKVLKEHL